MSLFRATLLLSCLLFGGSMSFPSLSAARAQAILAAVQPNLVVRHLGEIGGQITGIASSGTLIYLAQASGLTILDAADPQRITTLSRRSVASAQVRSVQLADNMAYLTTDQSIVLLNIAEPAAPHIRANIPTVGSIEAVAIQGTTMYLSISNTLQLLDLSIPARPSYRGSYALRGYPTDIAIVNNLAYITYNIAANLSAGGLDIVDVGNPAKPTLRGFFGHDGANRVAISGTNAYIVTNFVAPDQSELTVVDVRDPAHPKLRATIPAPGAGIEDIQVIEEHAYLVGEAGVTTVAIANPSQPAIRGRLPGAAHALSSVAGRLDVVTDQGVLVASLANPDSPAPLGLAAMPTKYPSDLQIAGDTAYLVNQFTDIQILDMHDPTTPTVQATIPISLASGLQVVGQLAYVTKLGPIGESELAVIDIGDPAHPLTLGSVPIGYRPGSIQVIGSTAYASYFPYKQFGSGGFRIIDVHDPTSPRIQNTFIPPSPLGTINDFQVVSGYAYLASSPGGFQILDISDPISPTLRASLTLGTSVRQVAVAGTHAYIVYSEGLSNRFAAIDISDPANPVLEMSISLPAMSSSPSELQVAESFAYISYGAYSTQGGVAIVDIHDPTTLVLRRFYQKNHPVELVRVIKDRLYLASGWAGLELASVQALNEQAWLPFALSQSIP
jgi:hypothetical protein